VSWGRRLAAASWLAVAACTPDPPPATPVRAAPPGAAAGPPASGLDTGVWGEFRSKRFDLALSLPDGAGWRIDDHSGPWLEASHPGSSSKLLVRTWHEPDPVNRTRCEERARSWAKLPQREGADILRKERLDVPAEFDTIVEIGVVPPKAGAALDAFAMAFGGNVRRCFAYVYTTSATGPDAEQLVGGRLAVMVDGSLGKVRLESELTPRIPREAPP